MKYKILLAMFILALFLFGSGITYSIFHSSTTMSSNTKEIAKFVFNTKSLDELQLSLIDLKPGDTKEYPFSVTNNYSGSISNVTVNYQIIIKTYHIVPLDIELYSVSGTTESLVMKCDESYSRNADNEIVCNSPVQTMGYSSVELNNYKLKVVFPSEYSESYNSNLVDYVDMEIKSWQKTSN